jgi:deoxyribonuclease-4
MKGNLLLGTHISVSGGIHEAVERGSSIGCSTMQVFTKNNNRWEGKPLAQEDVENYKRAAAKSSIAPVVAHAAYLINLCSTTEEILSKSRKALEDELRRSERLGLLGVILHPGSHRGAGEEAGIERIADSINSVHGRTAGFETLTILETTAGQGTALGYRFEQLRDIIHLVRDHRRMAVCIDTCHLFAAGYPIATEQGWNQTIRALNDIVGLSRVAAIHVNDSKRERGSRVDRHQHIGKGRIGETGFRMLMNDRRLRHVPKILETEKSEDMHEDIENMAFLRSLIHRRR